MKRLMLLVVLGCITNLVLTAAKAADSNLHPGRYWLELDNGDSVWVECDSLSPAEYAYYDNLEAPKGERIFYSHDGFKGRPFDYALYGTLHDPDPTVYEDGDWLETSLKVEAGIPGDTLYWGVSLMLQGPDGQEFLLTSELLWEMVYSHLLEHHGWDIETGVHSL